MEFNGTIIVAMVSFILFIIIMNLIYYKPILNIVEERQKLIDDNYSVAQNSNEQADALLAEKEVQLASTAVKAREMMGKKVDKTVQKAESITSEAKTRSLEEIQAAKQNLAEEESNIYVSLDASVNEIADSISEKILGGKY